jgi:hypothetical protein
MGVPSLPLPVKLIVAITYESSVSLDTISAALDSRFGEREYSYGPIPFLWTNYYAHEMGDNLLKVYFNYKTLIDRQEIIDIKLFTNKLELTVAVNGNRSINIDPGYLARDKFVLATTKDFYHRLYLGKGIYGEETLHYRKGNYRFFSWTYQDYRQNLLYEFLEKARAKLVKELRDTEDTPGADFASAFNP